MAGPLRAAPLVLVAALAGVAAGAGPGGGRVVARVETGSSAAAALAAGGGRLVVVDAGRPGVVSVPARGGRRTAGPLPGSGAPFGDRYQVAASAAGTWVARSGGSV